MGSDGLKNALVTIPTEALSDLGDSVVLEIVQEKSVKDVVEKVRMVFAGSRAIWHEVDLANHGLDRLH